MERLGIDLEHYKTVRRNVVKPKRVSIGAGAGPKINLNTSLNNITMDFEDSFIFKDSPESKKVGNNNFKPTQAFGPIMDSVECQCDDILNNEMLE
jgi:hypothetical protein